MAIALPTAGTWSRGGYDCLSLPNSSPMLMNWAAVSLVLLVTRRRHGGAAHLAARSAGARRHAAAGARQGRLPARHRRVGRDILSRVLYGVRASWFAALVVVAVGLLIGGLVGLIAGAAGGWIDSVLMRITDAFLSLPAPVLAIAVVAALGPGFVHTLIAVSIVWWPFYARLVRGEVARLAARPHVEAARLAGVGPIRLASGICCPARCPTRWSPPASTSAR